MKPTGFMCQPVLASISRASRRPRSPAPQINTRLARVLCITAAWAMNRNESRLPRIASSSSTASMMNTPRENRSNR